MKNILFYLLLLGIVVPTLAQDAAKNKKADKLYDNMGYAQFVELKGSGDIQSYDQPTLVKLGTSYRKLGDFKNAEKVFEKLVALENSPLNNLYYAQALQANGHYIKAKKHFSICHNGLKKSAEEGGVLDQRALRGYDACSAIAKFEARGNVIVTNEKKLNTAKLDFSPFYYGDGLVFVSNRDRASMNQIDIWLDDNCMDLYYAKEEDGGFSKPMPFSDELNSKFHEGPLVFTDDQQQVFFTRNDYVNGKRGHSKDRITKLKIYSATVKNGQWKNIEELPFNDKNIDVCHPALTPDERMLVFSSNLGTDNKGGMDLYASYWVGNRWSDPVNLGPEINTAGDEVFPYIHENGRLYYSSNGLEGLGGLDIYVAERSVNDPDSLWEFPLNIGAPFNSQKDDFGFIMAPDGSKGFFTSSRQGGQGRDDIYSFVTKGGFEKVRPLPTYQMQLCVFDKETSERIQGAEILIQEISSDKELSNEEKLTLQDLNGATVVLSLTPVEDGSNEYRIRVDDVNKLKGNQFYGEKVYTDGDGVAPVSMSGNRMYRIEARKNGYVLATENFTMPLRGSRVDEFCVGLVKLSSMLASNEGPSSNPNDPNYDPRLDPNSPNYDPEYAKSLEDPTGLNNNLPTATSDLPAGQPGVKGIVINEEYGKPLPNSTVVLLNRCTGEETKVKIGKSGTFAFPLDCECDYVLKGSKENFIGDNQLVSMLKKEDCDKVAEVELVLTPGFDRLGQPLKIGEKELLTSIKEGDLIELKNIYYDFDKYYIRKEAAGDLDDLAIIMRMFPSMEIELSSHTDSRASVSYNKTLSSNRAKSAKEYLVKKGIEASRINAVGYGESKLRNNCKDGVNCSEFEHQRNRRTEVFVTKFDKKDYIKVLYNDNDPAIVDPKR